MKNWVFDLDGTLVDSFAHYFDDLREIFARFGSTFTNELRHPALTYPMEKLFEKHLGSAHVEEAIRLLGDFSNRSAENVRPFHGVPELLSELSSQGSRVAVFTNRDFESASLILEHAGLRPFVDYWVSGTCVKERKPHPEGLLRICGHFGCGPAEVTMVGDHEIDVMAAIRAGARGVRASWHPHWETGPCPHTPYQFRSFDKFRAWALAKAPANAD